MLAGQVRRKGQCALIGGILRVPGAAVATGLLDMQKVKISLFPDAAPAVDQCVHGGVLVDLAQLHFRLALVPEHASHTVRDFWLDMVLVEITDAHPTKARSFFPERLQPDHLLIVFLFALRFGGLHRFERLKTKLLHQGGILPGHLTGQPTTRGRASHCTSHQADWYVLQFLVQVITEGEMNGRKRFGGGGIRNLPAAFAIKTQGWIRAAVDDLGEHGIIFHVSPTAARHVRLARAEPYFADQHVLQHGVAGLQFCGHADLQWIEFQHPLPLSISGGLFSLTAKGNRNLLVRCRRSPDGHSEVTLKNHVIRKHAIERDVGERGKGGAEDGEKRESG